FQAEDGIRDGHVTGVQTCALPIFFCIFALMTVPVILRRKPCAFSWETGAGDSGCVVILHSSSLRRLSSSERQRPSSSEPAWTERSEERRVGKECRCWWWPDLYRYG